MSAAFSFQFEQTLRKLGFTRHEIPILVNLFRAKKATAKQLSRDTAIPFSMVQLALTNLNRRKLVMTHTGDEDQYEAVSFTEFKKWLHEEKQKNARLYDDVEKDLDDFAEQVEDNSWQPTVQYFEGAEGIRDIYNDMKNTGEEIYTCTDLSQITELVGQDFMDEFVKHRVNKNIKIYGIRSKALHNKVKEKTNDKEALREIKVVPEINCQGEIKIYGNKCAFITFSENKIPVGFVIESPAIKNLVLGLYKLCWNNQS